MTHKTKLKLLKNRGEQRAVGMEGMDEWTNGQTDGIRD